MFFSGFHLRHVGGTGAELRALPRADCIGHRPRPFDEPFDADTREGDAGAALE